MRSIFVLAAALVACGGAQDTGTPAAATIALADSVPAVQAPASQAPASQPSTPAGQAPAPAISRVPTPTDTAVPAAPGIVRGLYVNRWAAQSARRMRGLIAIADSTEINAFVIDMKDEFGLNYRSADSLVAGNAGSAGSVPQLAALLDTLDKHGILTIARIVVFKDSVAARHNPDHVIRRPDGQPWRDKHGLTWVDPYDRMIWEYNIRVAEELSRLGFREIQFDYIRFPEPYKSLPPQVFRDANNVSKPEALANFFREACPRIHRAGARCTADIFGLVTTVPGALEVGQQWEKLSPVTDVLLPMVYPSHYPPGSFGVDRPNADPYTIVKSAISRAHERDLALDLTGPGRVRPWLQAFTLGKPAYGAHEIEEQKRAVYDSGYDGWVLWHPGSLYESFVPGLEKNAVSRRKSFAAARSSPKLTSQ
ncbi:MAG TPA: putative glycoside hydrolase [Sorangium sp.]|nr:putative glycoside hydrolase [Sorangium sp.]